MSATERSTSRKASLEVRKELLRYLGAPLGSVVVARKPTPLGDVLVVRTTSRGTLHPNRKPREFHGFAVDYEVVSPAKIRSW